MKKSLLLSAAIMIAASASAQVFNPAQKSLRPTNVQELVAKKVSPMQSTTVVAKAAKPKKMEAEQLYTKKVLIQSDYNETCYDANYLTFEEVNVEQDGVVYNVQMNGLTAEGTSALGVYDPEAGTLTFPPQVIAENTTDLGYSTEYGPIELYAVDAEGNVSDEPLVFEESEEGFVISSDFMGYFCYLPEYIDPETAEEGAIWSTGFNCSIAPVNAKMSYYATGASFKDDPEASGWATGSCDINYEDWETSLNINGFAKGYCVSLDINEDGETCTMAAGQQLLARNYDTEDFAYGYMCLWTTPPDEDGYLRVNYDPNSYLEGEVYKDVTLSDGTECDYYIRFFGVDADNKIINRQYFGGFTNADEKGQSYWIGSYFCDLEFIMPKPVPTGIQDNPQMRIDNIKNTKTYNLMGQQVDRKSAKGVLIRGGKKYIAK